MSGVVWNLRMGDGSKTYIEERDVRLLKQLEKQVLRRSCGRLHDYHASARMGKRYIHVCNLCLALIGIGEDKDVDIQNRI